MAAMRMWMVVLLVGSFVCADASTAAVLRAKWDILPSTIAHAVKDKGHEAILEQAFDTLTEAQKKLLVKDDLITGVQFNDMPNEDGTKLDMLTFLTKFYAAEKAASQGSSSKTAVARSHVGCRQTWHAMCPVARIGSNNEKANTYISFTNYNVRRLLINQINSWWVAASKFYTAFKASKMSEDHSDQPIGQIIHIIQDSFAAGHTIRSSTNSDKCGEVYLFQGYTMQDENSHHGDADHDPHGSKSTINVARRKELWTCAKDFTAAILKDWADCKADFWAGVKDGKAWCPPFKIQNDVENKYIKVSKSEEGKVAGGSAAFYAAHWDAKNNKFDDTVATNNRLIVRKMEVPVSSKPDDCFDFKDGKCTYEVLELKFDAVTKENVDKESTVPSAYPYDEYKAHLSKKGYHTASVCLGQLTEEEENAEQDVAIKWNALKLVKKLSRPMIALTV